MLLHFYLSLCVFVAFVCVWLSFSLLRAVLLRVLDQGQKKVVASFSINDGANQPSVSEPDCLHPFSRGARVEIPVRRNLRYFAHINRPPHTLSKPSKNFSRYDSPDGQDSLNLLRLCFRSTHRSNPGQGIRCWTEGSSSLLAVAARPGGEEQAIAVTSAANLSSSELEDDSRCKRLASA